MRAWLGIPVYVCFELFVQFGPSRREGGENLGAGGRMVAEVGALHLPGRAGPKGVPTPQVVGSQGVEGDATFLRFSNEIKGVIYRLRALRFLCVENREVFTA